MVSKHTIKRSSLHSLQVLLSTLKVVPQASRSRKCHTFTHSASSCCSPLCGWYQEPLIREASAIGIGNHSDRIHVSKWCIILRPSFFQLRRHMGSEIFRDLEGLVIVFYEVGNYNDRATYVQRQMLSTRASHGRFCMHIRECHFH